MSTDHCYFCDVDLVPSSSHCPHCGLWWAGSDCEFVPRPNFPLVARRDVALRTDIRLNSILGLFLIVVLGGSAIWAGLVSLSWVYSFPMNPWVWVALLPGLVVGFVGGCCALMLLESVLQHFIPGRLSTQPEGIRIRLWQDEPGISLVGLRRTDLTVPLAAIVGLGISEGRFGDSQLFIQHVSGECIGTHWSGSRTAALGLCDRIYAVLNPASLPVASLVRKQARRR